MELFYSIPYRKVNVMYYKKTDELVNALKGTDIRRIDDFFQENETELIDEQHPFSSYMRGIFKAHGVKQQDVFLKADFPQRYGYRLISGERRTRQRDYIIRLCLAAAFTLEETQRALQIYGMSRLYVRIPRDAILISAFQNHIFEISEVNGLLTEKGMPVLKASSMED